MRSRGLSDVPCKIVAVAAIAGALLVSAAAQETVLHSFQGSPDGANPVAGLVSDGAGNLYGTTEQGGTSTNCTGGCGTVFELSPSGGGYVETVLYSFGGFTDGASPAAGLILGSAGKLYGTTKSGGKGHGTVFVLIPATSGYTEQVLYRFPGGAGGASPLAGLTFDSSNNLWGTTSAGGTGTCAHGCGTVFELKAPGYTTLGTTYSFNGSPTDGAKPVASVIFDASGNLWGTTALGGTNVTNCVGGCGTVFELTAASGYESEGVLHSFAGSPAGDGAYPAAALIEDSSGNFYSTTKEGGSSASCTSGCGTVFELTAATFAEIPLYSFTHATDGAFPVAPLILDSSGNLYGTASQGGTESGGCGSTGCGSVFEISISGGVLDGVFDFNGADGKFPAAGLLVSGASSSAITARGLPQSPHGKGSCPSTCFGTTASGGSKGKGIVFEFAN